MKSLLVIDGDNISPNTFSDGWNNLEKDTILEKVVYGDFAKTEMVKWQKFAIENNIELFHCPRNNKKQTTDLNIFIDVMTKLYEKDFDKLFLVTNDSDFIILANAWIKKNKQVIFISSKNCSSLIQKNFNVIMLEEKKTKSAITDKTLENIINQDDEYITDSIEKKQKIELINTTDNIKDKLFKFINTNNETTIKTIQNELEKYYGKVKPKRIKKLLEKIDNNFLYILENENNIENSKVIFYPEITKIIKKNKQVKTLKTMLKKIRKVYPNISNYITFEKLEDLF